MPNKEELSEKAYQQGFDLYKKYGNCAQCTLLAVQETLGLKNDLLFKASTGFAGGTGLTGMTSCGALSGGIMAIGQRYGRERAHLGDPEQTQFKKTFVLSKKLHDRFVTEFGSTTCSNLLNSFFGRSYNLLDPEEVQQFQKDNAEQEKCPDVSGKVAQWVAELLSEEE